MFPSVFPSFRLSALSVSQSIIGRVIPPEILSHAPTLISCRRSSGRMAVRMRRSSRDVNGARDPALGHLRHPRNPGEAAWGGAIARLDHPAVFGAVARHLARAQRPLPADLSAPPLAGGRPRPSAPVVLR